MLLRDFIKGFDAGARALVIAVCGQAKLIRNGFLSHSALAGSKNIFGEQQLELDKWSNDLILQAAKDSGLVLGFASEELGQIEHFSGPNAKWGLVVDPLDGVSCVSTNLSVGTIAGFFPDGNVLGKGTNLAASLFVLYGPLTTMVCAFRGKGAHEFVFDEKSGEFVLRQENILIPKGTIFGSGGLKSKWPKEHVAFISQLEKMDYKLRFSGSLTADFNQVLHYGGLFCYPALTDAPHGKLRVLFEANPLALIAKEAGGSSSNGQKSILELVPKSISDRTPLYLGGKEEIALAEKFLKK